MKNNEILGCTISFFKVLVKKVREKLPQLSDSERIDF